MTFNILGLMYPLLFSITQVEPIWADLNGGMDHLPDLADITMLEINFLMPPPTTMSHSNTPGDAAKATFFNPGALCNHLIALSALLPGTVPLLFFVV